MIELERKRITTSPQIHKAISTPEIMWSVVACLVPAAAWGVIVFGLGALTVLLVSIISCVLFELLINLLLKRFTILDGSAVLTGMFVGFNLPPGIPLYIPIVACLFAIGVVKWTFGGLGANWMNPALAGRVFVFFSWTGNMTKWSMPSTVPAVDAVSTATPLSVIKSGLFSYAGNAGGPMELLTEIQYPRTFMDFRFTAWLNRLFEDSSVSFEPGYADMFLGNVPGCIGEISVLLLLFGTIYLFFKKIITWHIPVSYIGTFGLLVWAFGGYRFGNGFFTGNMMFHIFSGGLILGAFYMATDMVTSPLTKSGMIIFGIGVGFFTYLIRFFGSFPEGVSLAIILMNIFVPLINRYTQPKRFGVNKKVEES